MEESAVKVTRYELLLKNDYCVFREGDIRKAVWRVCECKGREASGVGSLGKKFVRV